MQDLLAVHCGDCREVLQFYEPESIQCCVTSPPYWGLRDYGSGLGLENDPEEYVENITEIFREIARVLKPDGTLWLNLGDSYAMTTKGSSGKGQKQLTNVGTLLTDRSSKIPVGLKSKDLVGIPWRVAFALQADGWYLRSDIIWHKPNPMPEPVTDRPTKSHEYIFLLTKSERYYYDADAIREPQVNPNPKGKTNWGKVGDDHRWGEYSNRENQRVYNPLGRNKRTVWTIPTQPYSEAHFATFPEDLIKPCILAGSHLGDTILDPFGGSGTTGRVALELGRKAVLIELNPDYIELINQRCQTTTGFL